MTDRINYEFLTRERLHFSTIHFVTFAKVYMFMTHVLIYAMCVYDPCMFSFRYVSCALGCPYEGPIEPTKVAEVRQHFCVAFLCQ